MISRLGPTVQVREYQARTLQGDREEDEDVSETTCGESWALTDKVGLDPLSGPRRL